MTPPLLQDAETPRSVALNPLGRDGDALVLRVDAVDGAHRWTLAGPLLSVDEANDLGAWLAGLPGDLTLGADEWTSLTFRSPALSLAGRRAPGGEVELRVSVLGMSRVDDSPPPPGQSPRTTDVVLGVRLAAPAVEEAAVAFVEAISSAAE
ncbi:hypothetical protein ASF88_04720 [Leifsonia sp. Leaf336]|uniref:WapI family immunity protein n=1 Tax=Leifsonia sp. Leaf336 TaxID=1736341 RepID=UPI0006FB67CA|nr:hypothetical protein [Leifsonia sp. Leaf336]KQR54134.1 hypothetical protein ASF88_04720 [Leifsonia sp. Leaf336]